MTHTGVKGWISSISHFLRKIKACSREQEGPFLPARLSPRQVSPSAQIAPLWLVLGKSLVGSDLGLAPCSRWESKIQRGSFSESNEQGTGHTKL